VGIVIPLGVVNATYTHSLGGSRTLGNSWLANKSLHPPSPVSGFPLLRQWYVRGDTLQGCTWLEQPGKADSPDVYDLPIAEGYPGRC
jgi:hypothetical protein